MAVTVTVGATFTMTVTMAVTRPGGSPRSFHAHMNARREAEVYVLGYTNVQLGQQVVGGDLGHVLHDEPDDAVDPYKQGAQASVHQVAHVDFLGLVRREGPEQGEQRGGSGGRDKGQGQGEPWAALEEPGIMMQCTDVDE